MANHKKRVVFVDIDHTLVDLLQAAVEWGNLHQNKQITSSHFETNSWFSFFGDDEEEKLANRLDFYKSAEYASKTKAVKDADHALKPLRSHYYFIAVACRPRECEMETRVWLDKNFSGVFDRVTFIEEDNSNDVNTQKRELYKIFNALATISSDLSSLLDGMSDVPYSINVGSVPWVKSNESLPSSISQVSDWNNVVEVLSSIIEKEGLQASDTIRAGPKLQNLSDGQVVVTTVKPTSFFVNLVKSLLHNQKQGEIRVKGTDNAVTTAVQVCEILKEQKHVEIVNIATGHVFRYAKGSKHYSPVIEFKLKAITDGPKE